MCWPVERQTCHNDVVRPDLVNPDAKADAYKKGKFVWSSGHYRSINFRAVELAVGYPIPLCFIWNQNSNSLGNIIVWSLDVVTLLCWLLYRFYCLFFPLDSVSETLQRIKENCRPRQKKNWNVYCQKMPVTENWQETSGMLYLKKEDFVG